MNASETARAALRGRVALMVGGDLALGRAVALLYAKAGADLAIVYATAHAFAAETQALVEGEGRRAVLLRSHPAQPSSGDLLRRETVARLGRLDLVIDERAYGRAYAAHLAGRVEPERTAPDLELEAARDSDVTLGHLLAFVTSMWPRPPIVSRWAVAPAA